MTREEAKKFLTENLGIEEPTEENVTNYLNSLNSAVQKEKANAEKAKSDSAKVKELQAKLDELESQNLSEVEKVNKELEKALSDVANLKKEKLIADRKASAMTKFKITQEQVDKVIKEDGELDFDVLSEIISEKEISAADAKEKELADGASNPNGASGAKGDEKTTAEKLAESITPKSEGNNDSVISSYL